MSDEKQLKSALERANELPSPEESAEEVQGLIDRIGFVSEEESEEYNPPL